MLLAISHILYKSNNALHDIVCYVNLDNPFLIVETADRSIRPESIGILQRIFC